MATQIGIEPGAPGRCDVFAPYNEEFAERVKNLGGEWNETKFAWSVDANQIGAIYELLREVFGADDVGDAHDAELDFLETPPLDPFGVSAFPFETFNFKTNFTDVRF